jgi:hypothetical protein
MARKPKSPATRKAPATRRKLESEARELGRRLEALITQARKAEAGARASAMRQIRLLQRQQAQAQKVLAKLGRQGAAAGEPILVGLQKAWRNIDVAVRQAAKRFRETS